MLSKIMEYLPLVLEVIGVASVAAAAARPIVERTKNKWDNKIVNAIGLVHSFLSKLALNPKV